MCERERERGRERERDIQTDRERERESERERERERHTERVRERERECCVLIVYWTISRDHRNVAGTSRSRDLCHVTTGDLTEGQPINLLTEPITM